jgi:hypothetical protein
LPMLTFAENRLWIARAGKPKSQAEMAACRRVTGERTWLIQPTETIEAPGFRPTVIGRGGRCSRSPPSSPRSTRSPRGPTGEAGSGFA